MRLLLIVFALVGALLAQERTLLDGRPGIVSANDKLTMIDTLIKFPPTASGQDLADMLGVSKTAVINSPWWGENRRGEKQDEIGRRRAQHGDKAQAFEEPEEPD